MERSHTQMVPGIRRSPWPQKGLDCIFLVFDIQLRGLGMGLVRFAYSDDVVIDLRQALRLR